MVATFPEVNQRGRTRPALIDCDLHSELDSERDLFPYLSTRWREHIETYGLHPPAGGFYPRFMDHRASAIPPSGRRAGSEVGFTRTDFLDRYNVAYGILNCLSGAAGQQNLELGAALARAVNEWHVN